MRYRWNGAEVVEVASADAPRAAGVQIIRDLPAYRSPLGDGWVDGRAARREHFKRTLTREVEPSEFRATYRNPAFASKRGLPVTQE